MTDDVLIWWLTQLERELIYGWNLPDRLKQQVSSAIGRPGRGRLWLDPGLNLGMIEVGGWETNVSPLARHCLDCAGIVVLRSELPALAELPGVVTDLKLRRV